VEAHNGITAQMLKNGLFNTPTTTTLSAAAAEAATMA
jgi:hypothetical protein